MDTAHIDAARMDTAHTVTAPLLVAHSSEATLAINAETINHETIHGETINDEPALSRATLVKQEAWWLLTSSFPLALSYLCQNSFNLVSLLTVGKLGVDELAAASLATMLANFAVLMPGVGLANALETFCAAAFTASRDTTRVGLHMQRGLLAVSAQLVPAAALLACAEPLLRLAGQPPHVAALCARFLRVWLCGSWPLLAFECLKRFVQAQGIMRANSVVMAAVMPVHVLASYALVWSPRLGLGFVGAPLATAISSWLLFLGMALYVALSDARRAWGGLSRESLDGLWGFYRLAVPGAAMLACSWAAFEAVTFGAAAFGPVSLAAQACIFSAMALTYQAPAAIGSAAATRIGHSLGLGRPRRARYCAHVAVAMGYVLGAVCSVLLFANRRRWGYLYSDDARVVALCTRLMPYFAAVQTFDGMNGLVGGVLRALGKQRLGALLAFPSFWVLGLPLGFYLAMGPLHLEVVGLWLGLAAAVIVFSVAQQWHVFYRVDWPSEVRACWDRLALPPKYSATARSCASIESYGTIA
ncbi:ethionine resistance protein [Coemansia sp. RSA 2611]|nr:ethionine resistance protein [Coemansia sp. RSA 2611]